MTGNLEYYQRMRRSVIQRYLIGALGKWPGAPLSAPAYTMYPNILAELDAMVWPNIRWLAECARVSPEIVAAVIEDNEDLTLAELCGMARCLRRNPDYLAAPALAIIDPATNKGKRKLWEVEMLLESIGDFDYRRICSFRLDALRRGEPITYATWRWICQYIHDELRYRQQTTRAHCNTRTERRR